MYNGSTRIQSNTNLHVNYSINQMYVSVCTKGIMRLHMKITKITLATAAYEI